MKRKKLIIKLKTDLILRIYTKGAIEQPYKTPEEYIEEMSEYFYTKKTECGWMISNGICEVLLERDEIISHIEKSDARKYIKPIKAEYKKLTDI